MMQERDSSEVFDGEFHSCASRERILVDAASMPLVLPAFQGPSQVIDSDSAARSGRALSELYATFPQGPTARSVLLDQAGYLEAHRSGDRILLAGIFIFPNLRGTGLGRKYLNELIKLADQHGAIIECTVRPFGRREGPKCLSVAQLTAWYERAGFKPVPGKRRHLRRMPLPLITHSK